MDKQSAKEYIHLLLDYQFDLFFIHPWGNNHVEFLFVKTAVEIEKHDLKDWFIKISKASILNQKTQITDKSRRPKTYIDFDFILFMAHWTRWPEFFVLIDEIKVLPEDTWRSNPLVKSSEAIAEALSDEWEGEYIYECFNGLLDADQPLWVRNKFS